MRCQSRPSALDDIVHRLKTRTRSAISAGIRYIGDDTTGMLRCDIINPPALGKLLGLSNDGVREFLRVHGVLRNESEIFYIA